VWISKREYSNLIKDNKNLKEQLDVTNNLLMSVCKHEDVEETYVELLCIESHSRIAIRRCKLCGKILEYKGE